MRLLGEIAGMTSDISARRRRLCEKLSALIDADVWGWLLVRDDPSEVDLVGYSFIEGGWAASEDEQRMIYHHGTMSPDVRIINDAVRGKSYHATSARTDLISDQRWDDSALLTRHFRPAGINEFMLSVYPLGDQILSSMIFLRRLGKPPFGAREKALAHLIVGQIDWLHRADPKVEISKIAPSLTLRQRQVLFMLLEGDGRKQIARKLRISTHTAADHIQAVYEHFQVNSQSELLSYFYQGGAPGHHQK